VRGRERVCVGKKCVKKKVCEKEGKKECESEKEKRESVLKKSK
jgi:hypothetical protein